LRLVIEDTKKQAGNHEVVGLNNVTCCAESLTTGTLRSFDRVNLDLFDFNFNFPVRSEVAETSRPFLDGGRRFNANRTDGAVYNVVATFTHFDNVLAAAAFSDATFFAPENTLCTCENCLTLHKGTPLFKA
jgi:hypothetical protein